MKYLIFIFLISIQVAAQESLVFTEVVELGSESQAELHNRAVSWFATSYNSPKQVIQLNQEDHVMGRALADYYPTEKMRYKKAIAGHVRYSIHIYLKDGRYKCEITNIVHEGYSISFSQLTNEDFCPVKVAYTGQAWRDQAWSNIKSEAELNAKGIFANLKNYMGKVQDAEDW